MSALQDAETVMDNAPHTSRRVGILTFHFARNYGALLQCYALQETLRDMGFSPGVIDYRPESIAGGYKVVDIRRFRGRTPGKFLRRTRRELQVLGSRRERFAAMEAFVRRRLSFTGPEQCDTIVVGSDQVWNPALTGGKMDRLYWGEGLEGKRLLAYSASIENGMGLLREEELRKALARFRAVSLREETALSQIRLLRPDARLCCDPVLLTQESLWRDLAAQSGICESLGDYLLYYQVRRTPAGLQAASLLGGRLGLRTLILSAKAEDENSAEVAAASPEDFLALLLGAKMVITTSFHGCALSALLHKSFLSLSLGDGRDSRSSGLLALLGLQKRIVCLAPERSGDSFAQTAGSSLSGGSVMPPTESALSGGSAMQDADFLVKVAGAPTDWEAVDRRIAALAGPSKEFLLENIGSPAKAWV